MISLALFFVINNFYTSLDNIGINVDFSEIFDKASTEEGKREMVPTYLGTNVGLDTTENLEEEVYKTLEDNESARFVKNSIKKRQEYNVNQLGNLIDGSNKVISNYEEVISKSYCDPYKDINYKICYKYHGHKSDTKFATYSKTCKKSLQVTCVSYETRCNEAGLDLRSIQTSWSKLYDEKQDNLLIGQRRGGPYTGGNYWRGRCNVIDEVIQFNITSLDSVENFILNRAVFDDLLSITLNDNLIYVGPYGGTKLEVISRTKFGKWHGTVDYGTGRCNCELGRVWDQVINKDLKPFLKTGQNVFKIRVIVSGEGQASVDFKVVNRCCREHSETWKEDCDGKEVGDKCRLISKICTRRNQNIIFEGKKIFKKCSEFEEEYKCVDHNKLNYLHENDCDKYDVSKCSLKTREFIDPDNKTERFIYKCFTPRLSPGDCKAEIQCIDGTCYEEEDTPDNRPDMLEALSHLSVIDASAKTIDVKTLSILDGENLKCKKSTKATAGFKDCCGSAHWGNVFSGCNADEKRLIQKRRNGDCIYIGRYCSKYIKLPHGKVCITRTQSYCCFSNKFSKVLANAVRQQALQAWGSPKDTNCRGIPIEKIQDLDFNKIDMKEVYRDLDARVKEDEVRARIQEHLLRLNNETH